MLCCAVVPSGCSDETAAGPKSEEDASSQQTSGAGLGKLCASNNDCVQHALTCYITNVNTGTGICSKGCKQESDCGGGTHCNPLQGVLACTPPQLCDACNSDDECGPDAPICAKFGEKSGFCSLKCNVGDGKCPGGYSCKQYGQTVGQFACRPDHGSCTGDGGHCAPCKTDGDCNANTTCFQSKPGAERFCAQRCAVGTNPDGCATGFKCASYGGKGYCYKVLPGGGAAGEKLLPTCIAGTKGFCDACEEDWECVSGRCATKNDKKFCAQVGTCAKESEKTDCPYGDQDATFCVPSNKGMICAPAPLFNCHGYKACLSHPCGVDELCDDGLCKAKK